MKNPAPFMPSVAQCTRRNFRATATADRGLFHCTMREIDYLTRDHLNEVGFAAWDGDPHNVWFVPLGGRTKSKIKNRLFTPKWAKDILSNGLLIEVESFSMRVDARTGRHYPVIRGKAVPDRVVKEYMEYSHQNGSCGYVQRYLSGETREVRYCMATNPPPPELWHLLPEPFEKLRRDMRVAQVWRKRYSTPKTVWRGYSEYEEYDHEMFPDRGEMIYFRRLNVPTKEVLYDLEIGLGFPARISKWERDVVCQHLAGRVSIPIHERYFVQWEDVGLRGNSWSHRLDYESNDGRSSRYEIRHFYGIFRRHRITLTNKVTGQKDVWSVRGEEWVVVAW